MSNYRKTMTEALQEMVSLDERMRMPRQLIDTNKEVMIVKKNKVVVIDKKDQDKYMKQGWELAEEVGLNEGTIDKVKEIASKKQAMKIDGVMVDSFTASAISQIYDKVNDATKKKMEKLPITKLANLAMKMMQKNEFVPEEVDLDEGTKQVLAHGGKGKYKVTKDGDKIDIKFGGKVVGTADFDRGADSFFVSIKGEKGQKSFDDAQAIADYFAKNKITEEVDLDENLNQIKKHIDDLEFERKRMTTSGQESLDKLIKAKIIKDARKAFDDMYGYEYDRVTSSGQESMVKIGKMLGMKMEEVDLDEGKMSQLHQYIKDKKSAEEIAKLMGLDVKTVKSLMSSHHPEEVEESKTTVPMSRKAGQSVKKGQVPKGMYGNAARDARRAMGRDPEMRQRAFSKDNSATDDDVKGASKNIMMQMRKAQSLNGRFDVEFADGKKVKIPAKMAIAVQSKYNKMRRPAEKEKFQAKIAKSYRDMLSALKEAVSPAQQAAIAISKKERGEKPKKESVLDRIDKKIKEKNDG